MSESPFQLRIVQLDLARQMETMEYIRHFIDLAAESGYNAVLFYIEGRVKTASVPFFDDNETYTPEQMTELVQYAAKRQVEVIPCVSTLGHAELFLKYPELAELSETRNNVPGRFGMTQNVFCPSQDKLWTFLETYLKEICDIFPSLYFHAGCDETFDLGVCELCRQKSFGDNFAAHIERSRQLLTKLGRRMMIWDDMYEFFPEKLDELSRDVILVLWNYDDCVGGYRGHFSASKFYDGLARYTEMGFETIFAPADYTYQNVASFTEYAWTHKVLGGLVTVWEKSELFMPQSIPTIYAAGKLWKGPAFADPGQVFDAAMRELFVTEDETILGALRMFCASHLFYERRRDYTSYLSRPHGGCAIPPQAADQLVYAILKDFAPTRGQDIVDDMLLALRSRMLCALFDATVYDYFRFPEKRERLIGALQSGRAELHSIAAARNAMWKKERAGLDGKKMVKMYEEYLESMTRIEPLADKSGVLEVTFTLPEQYSAPKTRFLVRYAGEQEWTHVAEGVYKNRNTSQCTFDYLFLIDNDKTPEALKIEVFWYGYQGICHLQLTNKAGSFVPAAVLNATGKVFEPWQLTKKDLQFALLGDQDPVPAALDMQKADYTSSIELLLKKA